MVDDDVGDCWAFVACHSFDIGLVDFDVWCVHRTDDFDVHGFLRVRGFLLGNGGCVLRPLSHFCVSVVGSVNLVGWSMNEAFLRAK